jgi:hypothetical protein
LAPNQAPRPSWAVSAKELEIKTTILTCEHPPGYISDKDKFQRRLRRVEGPARGISRMVDEETYCIDILTRISAFTNALQIVTVGPLDDLL